MITTFNAALQNNNVENLAYGSASENIQDMYRYRGAVRAGQKLTPAVAEDIRMGIASGAPNKTLAETYGVSQQTICDIKHKRIYAGGNV
jgi:phage tail tape-measure protein